MIDLAKEEHAGRERPAMLIEKIWAKTKDHGSLIKY